MHVCEASGNYYLKIFRWAFKIVNIHIVSVLVLFIINIVNVVIIIIRFIRRDWKLYAEIKLLTNFCSGNNDGQKQNYDCQHYEKKYNKKKTTCKVTQEMVSEKIHKLKE